MGAVDGMVAVVTGAGAGLGRAHALLLASEGARVVVNDIGDGAQDVVDEITKTGGEAVAHVGSVSDWEASEALIRTAVDAFGDLDVLVNNAGFTRDKMSFNMDEADFDAVVDVHLKGHFCPSRHAGVYWREQSKAGATKPRRIVNTTSEAGLFGSTGQANYSSAKAGIVSLTWVFARELARYGVGANVIAPRARTAMTESMPMFAIPEAGFDRFDPANISPVVVWLASDAAADVTGKVFIVIGGDVHLVQGFEVVSTVQTDGRWTPDGLAARSDDLFGDHERGLGTPGNRGIS
jgi:NAD(P)-dependent dehydrogenase (short-subunit alcohol dehydrogenase family)